MLRHLTDLAVHIAEAHALLAYFLAFLLTGAEAFPVIGALVPGTAIIIALGALVPAGALRFWPLVIWATAGAIIGDGLPFWFGYRFRDRAPGLWPLSRHPRLLPQGEAFFERYGGSAVILARFTPGVRAVVPIVAGISGLRPARFYLLDILSAVLWAPAHVLAGVLVGASLTILGAVAGRLEALLIGLAILAGLLLWLLPKLIRRFMAWLLRLRAPILLWSEARDSWVRRPIASLLDPGRTELSGLLLLAATLAGSLWLFLGILQDLIAGDPLVYADHAIFHLFAPYRHGFALRAAVAVSRLGSGAVTLAVAAVALLWLDRHRAARAATYGIAAIIGAALFAAGLNLALHRPPPPPLAPGWSLLPFPGGDLATASAFYGFLTVLIGRVLGGRQRAAVIVMTVLFLALQLGSRVYLGADWLSSELAAAAFGCAWAAGLGLAYVARPIEPMLPWRLVGVAAATVAVAGVPAVTVGRHADLARYEATSAAPIMACGVWQGNGWESLPARSLDMLGGFNDPLSIQWAGSAQALRDVLIREGWSLSPPWTFRNALAFLAPKVVPANMPALPRWNDGRRADLVMLRAGHGLAPDQRLVLRLWNTGVLLTTADGRMLPLHNGDIERQRLQRMFSTVTLPVSEGPATAALPKLAEGLPTARLVARAAGGGPVLLAGMREAGGQDCLTPPDKKGQP